MPDKVKQSPGEKLGLERVEVDGSLRSLSKADAQALRATGNQYNREECPTCGGTGKVVPGAGEATDEPSEKRGRGRPRKSEAEGDAGEGDAGGE